MLECCAVNYPIWDVPLLGGGLLIAAVAVVGYMLRAVLRTPPQT